jgi:hypothetical protein
VKLYDTMRLRLSVLQSRKIQSLKNAVNGSNAQLHGNMSIETHSQQRNATKYTTGIYCSATAWRAPCPFSWSCLIM